MPLLRYFVFVGGALLMLLFAADAVLPQPPPKEGTVSSAEHPAIRIHSDRKGPESVVLDTNRPRMIVPALTSLAPKIAAPLKADVRESFAQAISPQPKQLAGGKPKKVEVKPSLKRKIAASRINHPPMLAAPQFGLFDTTW